MITVSNDFKEEARQPAPQIKAYINLGGIYPDEITESDDLRTLKITVESSLCRSIMRQANATYFGAHSFLDEYVNLGYGLRIPLVVNKGAVTITIANPAVATNNSHTLNTGDRVRFETTGSLPTGLTAGQIYYAIVINDNTFNIASTYNNAINGVEIVTSGSQSGVHTLYGYPPGLYGDTEYIDYGSFKVIEQENNQGNDVTEIKMFDKMYEALQQYDLEPIYDVVYPCTLLEFLEAICDRLDWTLGTLSFPNDDLIIEEDLFSAQQLTFRTVLDKIAEASGSIIYFDVDDELKVRQISDGDSVLETLDSSDLQTLKVESHYGPINALVLSRSPQEDNIAERDESSITANGLTELKIINNDFVDNDRETYITPIWDTLKGLEFYPFEADTQGFGYFQIGDRIIVEDLGSNQFEVVIFGITLNLTGGLQENILAKVPDKTTTAYQFAGILGQEIKNTQIIVDRQNGTITLITEDITDLETLVTTLTQTVEGIQVQVAGIGGTNLIKNSVGLKGSLTEWQLLDENGDPIDPRNTGTIVQSTDVEENTESGSAILLEDEFISQTFATIPNETYTFYCRFNKDGDAIVSITGISDFELTTEGYVDNTWDVFSVQFIASSPLTTLRIETTGVNGCLVSDIVIKLGEANGWVQAPNEVYGSNFKFDKDGFEVSSLTDTIKAVLDNDSLSVVDTANGRIMMEVTKDRAKLSDVTIQEELKIQRYENPDKAAVFIPTATGLMLVINDL